MKKELLVTQVRSLIGTSKKTHKRTMVALGFGKGKMGKSVLKKSSPSMLGMVKKVAHLVKVQENNI